MYADEHIFVQAGMETFPAGRPRFRILRSIYEAACLCTPSAFSVIGTLPYDPRNFRYMVITDLKRKPDFMFLVNRYYIFPSTLSCARQKRPVTTPRASLDIAVGSKCLAEDLWASG